MIPADSAKDQLLPLTTRQVRCALDRAAGFVEGERYYQCGLTPPVHLTVGLEEYALGFRAGYHLRVGLLTQAGLAGFMNQKR